MDIVSSPIFVFLIPAPVPAIMGVGGEGGVTSPATEQLMTSSQQEDEVKGVVWGLGRSEVLEVGNRVLVTGCVGKEFNDALTRQQLKLLKKFREESGSSCFRQPDHPRMASDFLA